MSEQRPESASDVAGEFARIKTQAVDGQPVAQRMPAERYAACLPYSRNHANGLATLDTFAEVDARPRTSIERVKSRIVAQCAQVGQGQPIASDAITLRLQQAAAGGDVAAAVKVRMVSTEPLFPAEASRLIDSVIAPQNPDARLALSGPMSRPIDNGADARYARISGDRLAGAAWALAACRAGASCGNGSMLMDSLCVGTGRCNYVSYEEFVMNELAFTGERRRLDRVLSEISGWVRPR